MRRNITVLIKRHANISFYYKTVLNPSPAVGCTQFGCSPSSLRCLETVNGNGIAAEHRPPPGWMPPRQELPQQLFVRGNAADWACGCASAAWTGEKVARGVACSRCWLMTFAGWLLWLRAFTCSMFNQVILGGQVQITAAGISIDNGNLALPKTAETRVGHVRALTLLNIRLASNCILSFFHRFWPKSSLESVRALERPAFLLLPSRAVSFRGSISSNPQPIQAPTH